MMDLTGNQSRERCYVKGLHAPQAGPLDVFRDCRQHRLHNCWDTLSKTALRQLAFQSCFVFNV